MKFFRIGTLLVTVTCISSCESQQAGFSGKKQSPQARVAQAADTGEAENADRVINVPCGDQTAQNSIELKHKGSVQDWFQVKAEWCLKGKQVGRLKLMFLVDLSGSMKKNDPLVGDSCGRLAGARALIDKVQKAKKPTDIIEVATITFGSDARPVSDFVPLDDFIQTKLKNEIFCAAVDQTNYQGALEVATDLVQTSGDTQTPVVAYLLSDGLPSLGSESSQEDYDRTADLALQSAKSFLALGNVSLNAVYLKDQQSTGSTAPESYLAALTGGADKVKIVSNAEALGASITTLEMPVAKTSAASATATLTGSGAARRLEVKSVDSDPKDPKRIIVTTKRFQLEEQDKASAQKYTIKLKLNTNDESDNQLTVMINLTNG